jgi:transcriptional regulator with XRE-family HTH domain
MASNDMEIGSRIRAYRKKRGMTLNRLAEITGIAASNLSAMELNKSSPTLNTLVKIARAFDMKPGAFLDEALAQRVTPCPADHAERIDAESPGVSMSLLTARVDRNLIDSFLLILEAGTGWSPSTQLDGEQFFYCLEGEATIAAEGESRRLEPGDGLYSLRDTRLDIENHGPGPARFLIVTPNLGG